MAVSLQVQGGPYSGLSRADIGRRARAMLRALQLEHTELSIVLTDDDQIQRLNRLYRQKDKPTDVLAFPQENHAPAAAGALLGDVIVSVPTARRQAATRRRMLVAEVTMLLAHGLLHLVGWDHRTAAEDRRMRRETRRLCLAADAAVRPPTRRDVPRTAKKRRTEPGR